MTSHFLPFFAVALLLVLILFANVDSAKLRRHENSRIVGGRPANTGELPYQLQLRYNGTFVCGATLIRSPETGRLLALTAAHCVTDVGTTNQMPVALFRLVGGKTGLNEPGQSRTIQNIKVHPNYHPLDEQGSPGDIAMLQLSGQFTLTADIQPLALPAQGQQTTGNLIVSGWGLTDSNVQKPSSELRLVQLPMVNSDTCNNWYKEETGGQTSIYATNICAGFAQGGKGSCAGDSGGPAVGTVSGNKYLAGVISWGAKDCDAPKRPSVMTRVSSYMSWITNVSNKF